MNANRSKTAATQQMGNVSTPRAHISVAAAPGSRETELTVNVSLGPRRRTIRPIIGMVVGKGCGGER